MALSPCRECGRDVSTAADACPGCGAPWPGTPENELHRHRPAPVPVSIPRVAVGTFLGWLMIGACLMAIWIMITIAGLAIWGAALPGGPGGSPVR